MTFYIAYAPDDKYTNLTIISMLSIIKNNPNKKINFIILYSSLFDENIRKFKELKAENISINFVKQNNDLYKDLPLSKWVTVQAWYRISLPNLFPEIDKILYLDCDTLIRGDLAELFEKDLSNAYFAGVKDVWGVNKYVKRLSMNSNIYCNSGMLLMNCKFCRENDFYNKIVEFAKHNANIIEFCDQDCINKIADERKLALHPKYNYMDTWWRGGYYEFEGQEETDYLQARENPLIVHLTGLKPIHKDCDNKFKDEWWYYAQKSSIYDELLNEFNNSKYQRESIKDFLFSIKNEYKGKVKTKVMTILGIKLVLRKY